MKLLRDNEAVDARIADGDWAEAFDVAMCSISHAPGCTVSVGRFTRGDVAEVIATSDGEHEQENWIGVFRLDDGRFAFVSAGCDYTGWDCQASGSVTVADTLDRLALFALDDRDRERLGFNVTKEGASR